MPREHAPQSRNESTSHDSIVAERRAYLEQQAARSMGALVGDLTRITSGRDVAEYLVNYPQVDFGADEPSVYPLVHAAAEGPAAARRAGELVTIEPLGYNQVAIAARADGAAADAYTQAIEQHYQRSPYAQRLGDIALRLAQEHTDEPLPRVITTLDSTNPADQAIARQLDYSNAPLHITADNQLVEHAPAEPDQHRFLYSPSAKALLGAFDSAGLALTPRAHSELVAEHDGRYGNAYAWASREVFKLIAGRQQHLVTVAEQHATKPDRGQVGQPSEQLPQLQLTGDEAADALIELINQASQRGSDRTSQLPPVEADISIRRSGCKDVEQYFIDGLALGKVQARELYGAQFITKTHGAHTILNAEPVRQNGVIFPPGVVWARYDDQGQEGYAPLRLTGFSFASQVADDVMGREFAELDTARKQAFYQYMVEQMPLAF